MKLLKKLKEMDKVLHINNRFPNYINKIVFRIGFGLIVIALLLVLYVEDFDLKPHGHIYCDSHFSCINPLYVCNNPEAQEVNKFSFNRTFAQEINNRTPLITTLPYLPDCERYKEIKCVDDICEKEYLEAGERIGKEEPVSSKLFKRFTFWVILISFAVNHLLYIIGGKK